MKELEKVLFSSSAAAMLQQAEATHGPPSLTPPQGALTALCSAAWQGVDAAVLAQATHSQDGGLFESSHRIEV